MPCFIFGFAKANIVGEGRHMLDAVAFAPPFNQKECTLCNGNAFTLGVPNMPSICQALFFRYCRGPTHMTLRSLSHLTAERHGFPGMNLELSAAVSSILLLRMCIVWHGTNIDKQWLAGLACAVAIPSLVPGGIEH
jgi:hypothetical protein